MIRSSKIKQLLDEKAYKEQRKITYRVAAKESKVPYSTISKLANDEQSRFEAATLSALCAYFNCRIEDILEYVPDEQGC